jgi:hypothetical protein
LASGTLPNTGFCAEVWTCTGRPAELGPDLWVEPDVDVSELDVERWAQSAAGSTPIAMMVDMTAKTLRRKDVRRHCDRGVGHSAAAMECGLFPSNEKDKRFGFLLLKARYKMLKRQAIKRGPIAAQQVLS